MREFRYSVELGCTQEEWIFRLRPWAAYDGLPCHSRVGEVSLVGELFDRQGKMLMNRAGNPILIFGNTESALRFQAEDKLRRLFFQEPRLVACQCLCA